MSLLDFLFPKYSLLEKEGEWMTASELSRLVSRPRLFQEAELKSIGMPSLDRVLAVSTYSDTPLLRKAIHSFKYGRLSATGEILQRVLAESFLRLETARTDACICPVPLHFTRKFWRGFNQAEILSLGLAAKTGLPLLHLLRRVRPTGHQARRKREERLNAMRGAFRLRGNRWDRRDRGDRRVPYCVYLVDDLFTTGATMEECAKVLKAAGVRRVEGVVLAHG